jgi:ribosomal-protein-alanine N-acetyltransferase
MNLRPYTPADIDALVALDDLCFEPPFRFSRTSMCRFAEAPNATTIVAEVKAEMQQDRAAILAGFAILHIELAPEGAVDARSDPIGYIVTLDVAPSCRRQGIATTLMQALERTAVAAGCAALVLHVHTGNATAIRFYHRLGFQLHHTEQGFYGRGLNAEVFFKTLPAPPGKVRP